MLSKTYQKQVIEEKTELDIKRYRLAVFILNPEFKMLSETEKEQLGRQRRIMDEYSSILAERIKAFD